MRPKRLIYALNERPPLVTLAMLGFEHVAIICPYLVFVTLVVQAAGESARIATSAVSLAMIAVAIMTILQSLRFGPLGSGYMVPPVVSAIYFAPSVRAAGHGGLALVAGMTALAGLSEMVFSWALPRMRKIFPPVVAGFIVMAVGAELGLIGMKGMLGMDAMHQPLFDRNVAVGLLTLALMIGLSIWGRGQVRLLCVLIGLVVGSMVGLAYGLIPDKSFVGIAATPILSLPDPSFISYSFDLYLAAPFVIGAIASGLRTVGVVTTCQKINDANWRRPDLKNIQGGVLADGLGCAIGGLLSSPGMSSSPSLVGIEAITGATSRYIAYAIVLWLGALACFPKVGAALLAMPLPVVGAALVFNGGSMLVSGIQIIMSRPMTMRSTSVVGISFLFALSRVVYPTFYAALPHWTQALSGSLLSIAVVVCVGLNALFLLGERRSTAVVVDDPTAAGTVQFEKLLQDKGAEWEVNKSELGRAESSMQELLRALETGGHVEGPINARLSYDDYDLAVSLSYTGSLPTLPSEQNLAKGMVEEQIFAVGLSGFLSAMQPDRVESSAENRNCRLTLIFQT